MFYSYKTNPFIDKTIIDSPFSVKVSNNVVLLEKNTTLSANTTPLISLYAYFKSTFHILAAAVREKRYVENESISVNSIIERTITERFQKKFPYLITGGHFSVLYPRNLGAFYYPTSDPSTDSDTNLYKQKLLLYIKTIVYSLESFRACKKVTTTIVPVSKNTVTCINIYHYPSDSLYGILYGLKQLSSHPSLPYLQNEKSHARYDTSLAYHYLLDEYRIDIKNHINNYVNHIYDKKSGLVKKSITLSSAKDAVKRESAFYDNVVLWATLSYASEMGIVSYPPGFLDTLKMNILKTYWAKEGYFKEDLSKASSYSSDWLIVLSTGFLNPANASDRAYFKKAFAYIQKNKIDKPLPLKYQQSTDQKTVSFVSFAIANYQTDSIWPSWGLDYIKGLYLVGYYDHNTKMIHEADMQLSKYKGVINQYGGLPEVLDTQSKLLESFLYTAVVHTGWIVHFQQAQAIADIIHAQ